MTPPIKHIHHSDSTTPPSVLPNSTTGKRTYADAAQSPLKPHDDSLPPCLLRAKRRRKRHFSRIDSLSKRLFIRELGRERVAPNVLFARDKFRDVSLQTRLDSHEGVGEIGGELVLYRRRCKVIEIVSSRELVFVLSQNGVCTVFNRDLERRICFMNVTEDEVIRSLFLNKVNDSLITVSVFQKDEFSSLHCRSTPLAHIRKGHLRSAQSIFETESLKWPGFVEFDDVNSKILTFSAEKKKYKVWDLGTYSHLYTIRFEGIDEIKISPGIMLLIFGRQESYVPIRILDVENGEVLREINHMVQRKRKIDFIEQFHEKLLVKQENENLQIIDICSGQHIAVERSHFLMPNAFIFLYESELFLTFQHKEVSVWNFRGERVTTFEDHTLFHAESNTSSIYITQQQDIIVSYCQQDSDCGHGSINMSWIGTGKALGKITCGPGRGEQHLRALSGLTALYYNEERNEIYSGSVDGYLHIWSN